MSSSNPASAADPKLALKAELREAALARRDALSPDQRAAAAEAIASRGLPISVAPDAIVAGFSPIRGELNPWPLLRRLADAGAQLALPAIVRRGQPLIMRAWTLGEPLIKRQWGIREPGPDAPAVFPDLLVVPLAAFDRQGYRIGYGAGYYDLTLATLRVRKPVTAVGLGFAIQEVSEVPAFSYDERLDFVLTEREAIDCRGS